MVERHTYRRAHRTRHRSARRTDPALSGGEVRFRLVSSDQPYVRLPDRIELTLAEAGELLEVLDVAVATARTDGERATAQGLRR